MSYAAIDTRNRIGVRQSYTSRALGDFSGHRAPAETPPVAALFPTRPLDGVRDYNTQSTAIRVGPVTPLRQPNYWLPAPGDLIIPPPHPIRLQPDPGNGQPQPPNPSRSDIIFGVRLPAPSQQATPTPSTSPTTPPPGGVAISSGGPAAATAQPGTPVPVGLPTNQSYTDSQGNIWTYAPSTGWQVTGQAPDQSMPAPAGAPGAVTPGTTVTVQTGSNMWASITSWLQEKSIISGVPNFFLVSAAGLLALTLYSGGRRR